MGTGYEPGGGVVSSGTPLWTGLHQRRLGAGITTAAPADAGVVEIRRHVAGVGDELVDGEAFGGAVETGDRRAVFVAGGDALVRVVGEVVVAVRAGFVGFPLENGFGAELRQAERGRNLGQGGFGGESDDGGVQT